jgi:hypothetical protein
MIDIERSRSKSIAAFRRMRMASAKPSVPCSDRSANTCSRGVFRFSRAAEEVLLKFTDEVEALLII